MKRSIWLVAVSLFLFLSGCATVETRMEPETYKLVEVARSDRQWTGITVARDGRVFVNFPRWSDNVPYSVGVVRGSGATPFPRSEFNTWFPGADPATHLICVQSVVVDKDGFLWILDAANPKFKGVIPGGPKLVKMDLYSNSVVRTIPFAAPVIASNSYLNDVRIDTSRHVAYITDSGSGAIIVVDLTTGGSRRLLSKHPSTQSEDITVEINNKPWHRPDGSKPQIHADGIALDAEGKYLYYHALTGRTLYRIDTKWLRDPHVAEEEVASKVERVAETGAADGMEYGPDGRVYVTDLEDNAIKAVVPGKEISLVVENYQLAWPDTLAFGPDGSLYVTTSQIHLGPNPPEPYKIFQVLK